MQCINGNNNSARSSKNTERNISQWKTTRENRTNLCGEGNEFNNIYNNECCCYYYYRTVSFFLKVAAAAMTIIVIKIILWRPTPVVVSGRYFKRDGRSWRTVPNRARYYDKSRLSSDFWRSSCYLSHTMGPKNRRDSFVGPVPRRCPKNPFLAAITCPVWVFLNVLIINAIAYK